MRGIENLTEQEFVALAVIAPFEPAHAFQMRERPAVVFEALAAYGLLAFEGKPPAQRIGIASPGGDQDTQRGDAKRRINEERFVQLGQVAGIRRRGLVHQPRHVRRDGQAAAVIRHRPHQRAAALLRERRVGPAALSVDLVFHDRVVEGVGHRQEIVHGVPLHRAHEHRPRRDAEPAEQVRGEKGLVFAVAKAPPQHRAGRRGNLPAETRIHAEVADFILDESERPRAALRRSGGHGGDFFGQQKGDVMTPIRSHYQGVLVANMGYTPAEAAAAVAAGKVDAVAFGTAFLANPDLPARIRAEAPLNKPIAAKFYSAGAEGYTDYPTLAAASCAMD